MTRKHFEMIANVFKNTKPDGYQRRFQWDKDVLAMTEALMAINPRFDVNKFLIACDYIEVVSKYGKHESDTRDNMM